MLHVLLSSPIYQISQVLFPQIYYTFLKAKTLYQNIHQLYLVKSSDAFLHSTSFVFHKKEARCNVNVISFRLWPLSVSNLVNNCLKLCQVVLSSCQSINLWRHITASKHPYVRLFVLQVVL